MRADLIVVKPPRFGCAARLFDGDEQPLVQAFVTTLAVETLDEGVFNRLAGPDELQSDAAAMCPLVDDAAAELRAIVPAECQPSRVTASFGLSVDRRRNPRWLSSQILLFRRI
jgi:hypothetical protein